LVVHELKDPFLSPKQNPTPDNYNNNNNKGLGTLFLEQQTSGFSWKKKTGCSCRRIWFFDFLRTGWSTHTHTHTHIYTQPFISVGSFVWKKREPCTTTTLVGTIMMGSEGPWHVTVESIHRK
jgi:hypothetical protein